MPKNIEQSRPILVTGAPRSGTTFLGKILQTSPQTFYVHEPFNRKYGVVGVDQQYLYATQEQSLPKFDKILQKILTKRKIIYKFPCSCSEPIQTRKDLIKFYWKEHKILKHFFFFLWRFFFRSKTHLKYNIKKFFSHSKRILLKDPTICLSSPYLHDEYNFIPVILIRHPLGYVSSMKRLNWGTIAKNNFKRNFRLMNNHLKLLKPQINQKTSTDSENRIKQYALDWKCFYSILQTYLNNYPEFIPIKLEELSLYPLQTIQSLCSTLQLDFTDKMKEKIHQMTSSQNQAEAKNNKAHDLYRDSKKIVKIWKDRLNDQEIHDIKTITYDVAKNFYDEKSWQ